jgi:hypothetical protein
MILYDSRREGKAADADHHAMNGFTRCGYEFKMRSKRSLAS